MLLCAAGQFSVTAYAQNPLIVFVENAENATSLHEEVANSIAAICPNLGGFGQSPGAQRDLFLRCNEMINTAVELNGNPPPPRSLGISRRLVQRRMRPQIHAIRSDHRSPHSSVRVPVGTWHLPVARRVLRPRCLRRWGVTDVSPAPARANWNLLGRCSAISGGL